jgi:hypothetical protein
MARWDIDRDLRPLEPATLKGTSIQRILVETTLITNPMAKSEVQRRRDFGHIKLTREELTHDCIMLWCLGIGYAGKPKAFFYGTTIRQAYLEARKAVKLQKLAQYTPWERQSFTPSLRKKPKKREKRPRTKNESS